MLHAATPCMHSHIHSFMHMSIYIQQHALLFSSSSSSLHRTHRFPFFFFLKCFQTKPYKLWQYSVMVEKTKNSQKLTNKKKTVYYSALPFVTPYTKTNRRPAWCWWVHLLYTMITLFSFFLSFLSIKKLWDVNISTSFSRTCSLIRLTSVRLINWRLMIVLIYWCSLLLSRACVCIYLTYGCDMSHTGLFLEYDDGYCVIR